MTLPKPVKCSRPTNRFWIGGRTLWCSEQQTEVEEVDGEVVFRKLMLECNYDPRERDSVPTLRLFGDMAEHLAGLPLGRRVCLRGSVHTYMVRSEKTGRLRSKWSLDVDKIVSEKSASSGPAGDYASNSIRLIGLPLKASAGRVKRGKMGESYKGTAEIECEAEHGEPDRPKVVAYGIHDAYELRDLGKRPEIRVLAKIVTYDVPGKPFTPMSIVFTDTLA